MPSMLLLGVITAVVVYLELNYLEKVNFPITLFHQIAGFIISLVLVFRINTAYDRWWEGRKAWGSLLNTSRNLAIKLNAFIAPSDMVTRHEFAAMISSFAYSLKDHLRGNTSKEEIAFSNELTEPAFDKASHKPNFIHSVLTTYTYQLSVKHQHIANDYLVFNQNLNEMIDICGICERIRSTPIPYSYSLFIKKIVFIYVITMPFTFGMALGYLAIPIVMIMFYAFASLELLSEEIEDPFGHDANDLPTDELSQKIRNNVNEILLENVST
jgi:ion channel-forming bestrophin family protein